MTTPIFVPDIGNANAVTVIEIHVQAGDRITLETPLITLESDKASLDIPAPQAGVVEAVHLKVGDKVNQGTLILTLSADSAMPAAPSTPRPVDEIHAEVLVLGAGPGGYTAAFRAADLGKQVVLVERYPTLGGVCLNVGCIPSKALLHIAKVITEAQEAAMLGVNFATPNIDLDKIRAWKAREVVGKLTTGLAQMAKQRGVRVIRGLGMFSDDHHLTVSHAEGESSTIRFDAAIIAVGSQAIKFAHAPLDTRIMDSTSALVLDTVPQRLLIIGGGIIGLELGTVYDALGSQVSVVEFADELIAGCDRDLVRPLQKRMEKRFANIFLNTKVSRLEACNDGIHAYFEGENVPKFERYDRVLVAIGRQPNGKKIAAEHAGVLVDERGFIAVNDEMRTNVPHIFAIGDVVGQPMLAHKAVHQGKVAAEVIAGQRAAFLARVIPSVAYTDPEVAWVGVTEQQAKAQGLAINKVSFPWAASGRALSIGRSEGLTKLIFERASGRLIGAGIVGNNAGELLAEAVLAIEMGADATDLAMSIHAHPTLSETLGLAAEMQEGTITDLYLKQR